MIGYSARSGQQLTNVADHCLKLALIEISREARHATSAVEDQLCLIG